MVFVFRKKEEVLSVYEYVDDEIYIYYLSYGWVDDNDGLFESLSGLVVGRWYLMENMDFIFFGFLLSIVEEEEMDGEIDIESSEKF